MGRARIGKDNGELRLCTRCKEWKIREEEFYKLPKGPMGYHSACRTCIQKGLNAHVKLPSGLTRTDKINFIKRQPYCMICTTTTRKLVIDHCHTTGKPRALLCYACNSALGDFKDDITLLRNAILYLEHFRELHNGL